MALTEDEEFELLSLEREKAMAGQPQQQPQQDSNLSKGEQRMQGRGSAIAELVKDPTTLDRFVKHPLGTTLRTLAGAAEMMEAPISSVAMDLQKGDLRSIPENFMKAITGQRPAQYGDVYTNAGASEPLASTAGLLTSIGLTPPANTAVATGLEGGYGVAKSGVNIAKEVPKQFGAFQEARKELPKVKNEIKNIQKMFGLEKTDAPYINTHLNKLQSEARVNTNKLIDNLDTSADEVINSLKSQKDRLEDIILHKKEIDFADFMKKEGPAWAKQGSEKYGLELEKFGKLVDEKNPVTAEEASSFLQNLIMKGENTGIENNVVSYLKELNNKYSKMYPGQTVPWGEFKSQMSGVYNHVSSSLKSGRGIEASDVVATQARQEWSNFLKSKLPSNAVPKFEKLQEQYGSFAEAKKMMGKMFNPYGGELDISKAMKTAKEYALNEQNESLKRLMNVLEGGVDDFVSGIPKIGEKAMDLQKTGSQIKAVKETIPVIKQSQAVSNKIINENLDNTIANYKKWSDKYKELASREKYFDGVKKEFVDKVLPLRKIVPFITGLPRR